MGVSDCAASKKDERQRIATEKSLTPTPLQRRGNRILNFFISSIPLVLLHIE
jgi:hypothetical protein